MRKTPWCVRRKELEVKDLECALAQGKVRGYNILVCGMCRSLNANQNYWNLVHESVDRDKSTNIQDIIIVGGIKNDLLVSNRSKNLQELTKAYNLKQLINEVTHFTEALASLTEVILVNKTTDILATVVFDPFILNTIRFHWPVVILLKFL